MKYASQIARRAARIATVGNVLSAMPLLLAILLMAPVLQSGLLIME